MSDRIIGMLLNTPIEQYKVAGRTVYVKREDLCAPEDWPPFSKLRGLYAYLRLRKTQGLETVGYTETTVSMAGWGIAAVAHSLGMRAVIFPPDYKHPEKRKDLPWLEHHRQKWVRWGAEIVPLPAARHQINWYRGKNYLTKHYGTKTEMLPLGIPFQETVEETAKVWQACPAELRRGTTVACMGSGTIFSGLMRGWQPGDGRLVGVLVHKGINAAEMLQKCMSKAHRLFGGLVGSPASAVQIIDGKWDYHETGNIEAPFPCHQYYDLKGWQWLVENLHSLPDPVMFWNIGHSPVETK